MSPNALALVELLIRERRALSRFIARYLDPASTEDTLQNLYLKASSVPGVFCCGDAGRMAGSVAFAVADGAMAGVAAHRSLMFGLDQAAKPPSIFSPAPVTKAASSLAR